MTNYTELTRQLTALVDNVPHFYANLANAAALLWQSVPDLNWAGFYLLEGDTLILGPFQGKPACMEILLGRGVCGTAAKEGRTVLVENVHDFPGHIACDSASNAEIVIPLYRDGTLLGVLDLDSPTFGRFTEEDRLGLEGFARALERAMADTPTPFLALAKNRYSVRKFQPTPLDPHTLNAILEAGHIAPTGCNYQPYRVLVLNREDALQKLKSCTKCHFDAPCALLICCNKTECWTRKYDGEQSGTVDAAIVTTHMMLEAAARGVGSTWVMHFDPVAMRDTFRIPEELTPVALLTLGYPAPDAKPLPLHSEYRPMEELVIYDTFS